MGYIIIVFQPLQHAFLIIIGFNHILKYELLKVQALVVLYFLLISLYDYHLRLVLFCMIIFVILIYVLIFRSKLQHIIIRSKFKKVILHDDLLLVLLKHCVNINAGIIQAIIINLVLVVTIDLLLIKFLNKRLHFVFGKRLSRRVIVICVSHFI